MEIKIHRSTNGEGITILAHLTDTEIRMMAPGIQVAALEKIAQKIAEEYLMMHAQEIMANINPQAVANLAVVDAASALRDAIDHGSSSLVRELKRPRNIELRGIFGGRGTVE